MNQRGGPPTGPVPHRTRPRLAILAVAIAIGPFVACSSSGGLSQNDFETVITESRIGTETGASVARDYAGCLYRETDGEVDELVDHVDDTTYQPTGATAEAVAACSDVLINAG